MLSLLNIKILAIYLLKLISHENIEHASALYVSDHLILNSIIKPFSNCSTILYFFEASNVLLAETPAPIAVYEDRTRKEELHNSTRFERCSFVRRRNPSKHCRALLIVQPESNPHFVSLSDKNITLRAESWERWDHRQKLLNPLSEFFTPSHYGPQYTIWISTLSQKETEFALEEFAAFDYFSRMLLFVKINLKQNTLQTHGSNGYHFQCYNRYYINATRKWIPVSATWIKSRTASPELIPSQQPFHC